MLQIGSGHVLSWAFSPRGLPLVAPRSGAGSRRIPPWLPRPAAARLREEPLPPLAVHARSRRFACEAPSSESRDFGQGPATSQWTRLPPVRLPVPRSSTHTLRRRPLHHVATHRVAAPPSTFKRPWGFPWRSRPLHVRLAVHVNEACSLELWLHFGDLNQSLPSACVRREPQQPTGILPRGFRPVQRPQ